MHGQFSVKSDVYSFGVIALETITGKKNSRFYQTDGAGDLLSYSWKHWRDGTPLQLLDSNLTDSYSRDEVIRCIHVGLLCVHEDPADRPSMATTVLALNSYSVTLPVPDSLNCSLVVEKRGAFQIENLSALINLRASRCHGLLMKHQLLKCILVN
ncbi:hypothetical protein WN944_014308 [Citrus x changshan-huyou]|uniref:Protein kinase domain-containing protein n=3 Tax=Citrus TaxID=2706 RepID=A0A067DEN0_CITSI|nr:hypothetical protein CISIN_1g037439mg [Citrus sinensis]GAY63414.1 hypothetical protein CUMW_225380 [Citrus unshiu]